MPYPDAIKKYPESMQIFIKRIHSRIESGKNALIAVVGGTGSGKSYSTITIMIALDEYRYGTMREAQWYVDHCIFRAKALMQGLNDPELKLKTTWIWDEAGVDAGTQEYATIKNRVIGWLGQTFRNLQQVVFFTLPTLGMLTPQIRKLLHFYTEAKFIDKPRGLCYVKPLEMQYNTRMDKIYYHNLGINGKDGEYLSIDMMAVPKAPQEILDLYEAKKSEFTRNLNKEIEETLDEIDRKKEKKNYNQREEREQALLPRLVDALENKCNSQKDCAKYIGVRPSAIPIQLYLKAIDIFRAKQTKNEQKS